MIAEKYALPDAVEHLASFVHLLPENKVKQQYRKISNIQNTALQERLLWKFGCLSQEMKEYALLLLSQKIEDLDLQKKLLTYASYFDNETVETVKKKLQILKDKNIVRVKGMNPKFWTFDEYNFHRLDDDDEIFHLLCNFEDVDFDKYFTY